MKAPLLQSIAILFLTTLLSHGETPIKEAEAKLDKLIKIFPSLYWYASDACMFETSSANGQGQEHDEFVKQNRAIVNKIEEVEIKGSKLLKSEIQLIDPKEPEEHWIFEFIYTNGLWNTHTAYKYFGSKRAFDLYKADFATGSMRPYIQKCLEAFAEGKDPKDVYRKK